MCLLTLFNGCKKGFFDTVPDNIVTVDKIFATKNTAESWFFGLYSGIQDIWQQPYNYQYPGMCDEIEYANWFSQLDANSGSLNSNNSPSREQTYFQLIRNINIFLENIDKNTEIQNQTNGVQIVKQYKAEAKFLRAYYCWLMMKELGPIAIPPTKVGLPTDNYQIPRSSVDECIDFILKEMKEAEPDLASTFIVAGSENTPDEYQVGRITLPIAAAIESQIQLAFASPIFNGNTLFSEFKNPDGKQLFNQTYDPNRWKLAAEACKRAIDLNKGIGKNLFIVPNSDLFLQGFNSTKSMFWDGWRQEGIWTRAVTDLYSWSQHSSPKNVLSGNGWNGISVLQELVDDFRMSDGTKISESTNYTEVGFTSQSTPYYSQGTSNMYVSREPRFYVDVTFNGSTIPVVPAAGQKYVEYQSNSKSGKPSNPRDYPKSGYTARKNIHPNTNFQTGSNPARPAMLIRMAELYLSYAEALNEYDSSNPDILIYLNAVRNRGGIPPISSQLNQAELRDAIRLERRIELCFESAIRYWDVRRWMVPEQPKYHQGGDFYGMNMNAGTSLSDPAFYKRVVITSRAKWSNRMYFWPYKQAELDRNKQLVQFPGY